jgi:hypothetical protein
MHLQLSSWDDFVRFIIELASDHDRLQVGFRKLGNPHTSCFNWITRPGNVEIHFHQTSDSITRRQISVVTKFASNLWNPPNQERPTYLKILWAEDSNIDNLAISIREAFSHVLEISIDDLVFSHRASKTSKKETLNVHN